MVGRKLKRRAEEKQSYRESLQRKVDRSRASIAAGQTLSQEEVEVQVAARREKFLRLANESEK